MKFWRIRKIDPTSRGLGRKEDDGHHYFLKDKMSHGTGIIYLSEQSANRALVQVNGNYYQEEPLYEIVEFEAREV